MKKPRKVLTMQPHYAHAVAWLGKKVVNRARRIPRGLVGERVAIHAAATLPSRWVDDLALEAPRELAFVHDGPRVGWGCPLDWEDRQRVAAGPAISTRMVVATALLSGNVMSGTIEPPEWALRRRDWWWWILADVRPLEEPVPINRWVGIRLRG